MLPHPVSRPSQLVVAQSTKPFPFCAEPILVFAVKCKHCGEFLQQAKSKGPSSSPATEIGMIIVLVGGAIVLGAMIMDTTVASGFDGKRYYNSGLQQVQMKGLLIGLTVGVIGIAIAIVYWPKQGLYLSSKLLREVLGALNVLGGGASSIGTGASEDSSSPKIKGN